MPDSLSPTAPAAAPTFLVSATLRIEAPPAAVYGVFADYRVAHPRVLPPRFFTGLTVERGGTGAGTVVLVEGRFAGRTRTMRGFVTEPEPGRLLVEDYPDDRTVTSFLVEPVADGKAAMVTISSRFPRRPGLAGWFEEWIVRRMLSRVYREELDLVVAYLSGTAGAPASGGGAGPAGR